MTTEKLNLYIWKDIVGDYGIATAFAFTTSESKARLLVELDGCDPDSIKNIKPEIITEESGFYNCGFHCGGS